LSCIRNFFIDISFSMEDLYVIMSIFHIILLSLSDINYSNAKSII